MGKNISKTGFTLAEMLVVIVIMISLAGLVVTAVPRIMELAYNARCGSNLRQIGQALRLFAIDHNGFYPPVTRPNTRFGDALQNLSDTTKKLTKFVPWYYELIRSDSGFRYGLDERVFLCPADRSYDPKRQFDDLGAKTAYMSDNISYGFNYDVKYSDGMPYRVGRLGGGQWDFVDASGKSKNGPSGLDRYPDYYRAEEIEAPSTFIVAADSNSEFANSLNFGISIPIDENSSKIGARHRCVDRPGANVLFADDHVELWASRVPQNSTNPATDAAKDINDVTNRRYWTLAND